MMTAIMGITLFVTIPVTQVIRLMNMFTEVAGGGAFAGAAAGDQSTECEPEWGAGGDAGGQRARE